MHGGPKPPAPSAANLDRAWNDALTADAAKAFAGIKLFAAHPNVAVPFLRRKLVPVSPPDHERVDRLLADLDHNEFRKRELATRELAALGDRVRGALQKAQSTAVSEELRKRVEKLLAVEDEPSPEMMRLIRAIEAMEAAGTPEAMSLLDYWAGGASGAFFTRNADAARKRLASRLKH